MIDEMPPPLYNNLLGDEHLFCIAEKVNRAKRV